MSNNQQYDKNEQILLRFVKAQSEEEVSKILNDPFFDKALWKPYGGTDSNFGTITNQMGKATDSLCEKPINSIDAILTKECLKRGINPEDQSKAPKSMKEAAQEFLDIPKGDIKLLSEKRRGELAKNILIIADGSSGEPNITIADRGEGQRPDDFEETLLSLNRSNKNKIKFVQGKFNQGGTGVLPYCGEKKYQFVLSRRSIEFDKNSDWGFTLVRKKPDVPDNAKLPWFEFFTDHDGKIFRFPGKPLPILPWGEELVDGCFIKLFNYRLPNPTDVTRRGLWGDMNRKLYAPVHPLYIYEMRHDKFPKIKGKNDKLLLSGTRYRILTHKEDIRERFPIPCTINGIGELKIETTIFNHSTLQKGNVNKTVDYTNNKPLYLTINGQSHFEMEKWVFRSKTALPTLSDYMMIHIDLSKFDKIFSEIFMGSRDRVRSDSKVYKLLEERIFEDIRIHPKIVELEEEYKRLNNESYAKDPTINGLIRRAISQTPSLWKLFGTGDFIDQPEAPKISKDPIPFKGKPIPTYLKPKSDKEIIGNFEKKIPFDGTPTFIYFVTDAEEGYDIADDGTERLHIKTPPGITYTNFGLHRGQISIKLIASSNAIDGDVLDEKLIVTLDRPNAKALVSQAVLQYYKPKKGPKRGPRGPRKYPGVNPPELHSVTRDKWGDKWDEEKVVEVALPDYVCINIDCKYLQDFLQMGIKTSSEQKKIIHKFMIAIYILAIYQHKQWEENPEHYEDGFHRSMRATAEGILPTINLMKESEIFKSLLVEVT